MAEPWFISAWQFDRDLHKHVTQPDRTVNVFILAWEISDYKVECIGFFSLVNYPNLLTWSEIFLKSNELLQKKGRGDPGFWNIFWSRF